MCCLNNKQKQTANENNLKNYELHYDFVRSNNGLHNLFHRQARQTSRWLSSNSLRYGHPVPVPCFLLFRKIERRNYIMGQFDNHFDLYDRINSIPIGHSIDLSESDIRIIPFVTEMFKRQGSYEYWTPLIVEKKFTKQKKEAPKKKAKR